MTTSREMQQHLQRQAEVFDGAVELPAKERDQFVRRQCEGDTELRDAVNQLLMAHQDDQPLLPIQPQLPSEFVAAVAGDVSPARWAEGVLGVGDQIGSYKLLERIGEGGMGVVFMAQQRDPVVRKVALKIIKPGMDTRSVIARFEAERQALAMMDHPSITRVFDAGSTPAGHPFFAMELVGGEAITKHCEVRKVSVDQKVRLFIEVCHAVQHAHQKGVIHRDIKPSNVLVTTQDGRSTPKVIDFGIAKATAQPLTDKTLFTRFGDAIGTPEYMSPEQLEQNGSDIDTRSDIYSLGVLLCELLTGRTPLANHAGLTPQQRLETIRASEPVKPSTLVSTRGTGEQSTPTFNSESAGGLSRLLRGDLDWIVIKCLAPNREDRYQAASSLSADLQRYLDGEPTTAAAPSWSYLLQKNVRRHRLPLLFASTVLTLLVIGTAVSSSLAVSYYREASRASRAEVLAQQRLDDANQARSRAEASESRLLKIQREQKNQIAIERATQRHLLARMGVTADEFSSPITVLADPQTQKQTKGNQARTSNTPEVMSTGEATSVSTGIGNLAKSLQEQGINKKLSQQLAQQIQAELPSSSTVVTGSRVVDAKIQTRHQFYLDGQDNRELTKMILEEQQQQFGSSDRLVIATLVRLAGLHINAKDWGLAENCLREALSDLPSAQPRTDQQTQHAQLMLCKVLIHRNNLIAARELFDRVVEGLGEVPAKPSVDRLLEEVEVLLKTESEN